jgi:hypothetical protein
MEAMTSRPLQLAAVGRAAHGGGQTTLYLTPLHGKANIRKPLIANIHAALAGTPSWSTLANHQAACARVRR